MQMTSNNRRVVALIDDDAAVCDSMRCLLEAYDLDVQTYQSGPDFLKEEEPGIDCLIVDCYMPGLDGLELVSELRKRGSQVPIIMMTTTTNSPVQRRAAELGIKRFLEKPFSHKALLSAIREEPSLVVYPSFSNLRSR